MKRPIFVYILAISFILAPFGNIALSLRYHGIEDWYDPTVIFHALPGVSTRDLIWLSMVELAGILLLWTRRLSWTFAIAVLGCVSAINFYIWADYQSSLQFAETHLLLSSLGTGSIFLIIYFFRFPYIDRREGWWGVYRRYETEIPARIEFYEDEAEGIISDLSLSGARVRILTDVQSPEIGHEVLLHLKEPKLRIAAKVVRRINTDHNDVGVHFVRKSIQDYMILRELLRNLKKSL